MTSMPFNQDIVVARETTRCHRCTYHLEDLPPIYYHADICDYILFRDFESKKLGFVSVENALTDVITGEYLSIICTINNIPFKAFKFRGYINSGYDIFVPESVATAIQVFSLREDGFAGLTLEDFLTKMYEQRSE
jgi:hypothetical protein